MATTAASSSTVPKEVGRHVLVEQFDRIARSSDLSEEERCAILTCVVNYLSDFFGYLCVASITGASSLTSASGFDALMCLVDRLAGFVFEELAHDYIDNSMFGFVCGKLTPLLAELKHFKNA